MLKVLLNEMLELHNVRMEPSNVRKDKGTTKCDKRTVTCDIGTTQCEGSIKCDKKIIIIREPPNLIKELSYVMLELQNVRIKPLNGRKK